MRAASAAMLPARWHDCAARDRRGLLWLLLLLILSSGCTPAPAPDQPAAVEIDRPDGTAATTVSAPGGRDAGNGATPTSAVAGGDGDSLVPAIEVKERRGWCCQNPLPTCNDLEAVWGSGSRDVFAVGEDGAIVHYDGRRWQARASGGDGLRSVWAGGRAGAFAVGEDGKILHRTGRNANCTR